LPIIKLHGGRLGEFAGLLAKRDSVAAALSGREAAGY
jgi:hypothetical protein